MPSAICESALDVYKVDFRSTIIWAISRHPMLSLPLLSTCTRIPHHPPTNESSDESFEHSTRHDSGLSVSSIIAVYRGLLLSASSRWTGVLSIPGSVLREPILYSRLDLTIWATLLPTSFFRLGTHGLQGANCTEVEAEVEKRKGGIVGGMRDGTRR